MSAILPIITDISGQFDNASHHGVVDMLELTSEERASAHFTATTTGGRRIRLSLPRGVELQDGDVLYQDEALAIIVRAAAEELLLLRPDDDPVEWHAACYQLGNLHRPARFIENGVLTPRDPMVMQFLAGLNVSVTPVTQPFTGRRFGAAGAHHHNVDGPAHAHDIAHAHEHDHAHSHQRKHVHDHAHGHEHGHSHPHEHHHDHHHGHAHG